MVGTNLGNAAPNYLPAGVVCNCACNGSLDVDLMIFRISVFMDAQRAKALGSERPLDSQCGVGRSRRLNDLGLGDLSRVLPLIIEFRVDESGWGLGL